MGGNGLGSNKSYEQMPKLGENFSMLPTETESFRIFFPFHFIYFIRGFDQENLSVESKLLAVGSRSAYFP